MGCRIVHVAALLLSLAATAAAQEDGSARQWNQARGNAARTAWVDVAPIRSQPEIVWRWELPGTIVSTPVAWEGVVYVATKNTKDEIMLSAVQAVTGEMLASRSVGKCDWTDLAVLRSTVFVVQPDVARSVKFDGRTFSSGWTVKGAWAGQPAVAHGRLILADDESIRVLDAATGRDAVPACAASSVATAYDFAAVCARDEATGGTEIARLLGSVTLRTVRIVGLGTRTPSAAAPALVTTPFRAVDEGADFKTRSAVLASFGDSWIAVHPDGFRGGPAGMRSAVLLVRNGNDCWLPIARAPAIVGAKAYGSSAKGIALAVNPDGSYSELTKPQPGADRPRLVATSAARGVVYFGDSALEIDSGRVLWRLPDLAPTTPLLPVGDGRAVCVSDKNVLLGVAEPGLRPETTDTGAVSAVTDEKAELPDDSDGVLLADGRFVRGKARAGEPDHVRVTPEGGVEQDLAAGAWVLAQDGGRALVVADEPMVLAALEKVLDRRSVAAWEAVFRKYADVPLVSDALRVLSRAKSEGLAADRARRLEQWLAGKRDHVNADLQRKRLTAEERAVRDEYHDDVRAASKWCAERTLRGAAAALLSRVLFERPEDPLSESAARDLVPAAFPWARATDVGARWIRWAAEIVPAGGVFVPRDAPEANRRRGAVWSDGVVMVRTRNVLLVSKCSDPTVVGLCVRHAEGAVRACENILGPPSRRAPSAPMEVRLHADRESYLAEVWPSGERADAWSSGCYSPRERASRFYVPSPAEAAITPLRFGLLQILAHELTHQWIDLRWEPRGAGGATTPGYWAVEGIAQFIEDQSVETGRRGGRLDDNTVESLDVASQLEPAGLMLPLSVLLALTQDGFARLSDEPKREIRLRHKARILTIGPRTAFYHQSGALVFWLAHGRGPEGRSAFAAYLRSQYRGEVAADGAPALGAASPEELQQGFRAFLAELRK